MITARFRALSPIAHGAFGLSAGNATLCRRMPIVSLPGMPRVPVISGNALRGVMRRIIMRELLAKAGLSRATVEPGAWDRLYAAIANGGHLDNSETSLDPNAIRDLRESLPPLSVFGAALYSWMLPGHLTVGFLWPVCAETVKAGLVRTTQEPTVAAEDLITEVSMCRHIDREHQDPEKSGVTPMPTTVEAIAPGAILETRINFADHATTVERSVIAYALGKVRTLGGKSGGGLGAVSMTEGPSEGDAEPYRQWMDGCADLGDRIRALSAGLAPKAQKAPKGRKADAAAADA